MPDLTPLAPAAAFFWGMFGSAAVEVLAVYSEMKTPAGMKGVSSFYRSVWYWLVRLLVAVIAGGVAFAEDATKALVAIHIGASAPAIFQLLTRPPDAAPAPTTRGSTRNKRTSLK